MEENKIWESNHNITTIGNKILQRERENKSWERSRNILTIGSNLYKGESIQFCCDYLLRNGNEEVLFNSYDLN